MVARANNQQILVDHSSGLINQALNWPGRQLSIDRWAYSTANPYCTLRREETLVDPDPLIVAQLLAWIDHAWQALARISLGDPAQQHLCAIYRAHPLAQTHRKEKTGRVSHGHSQRILSNHIIFNHRERGDLQAGHEIASSQSLLAMTVSCRNDSWAVIARFA
jgi:hypothetical protein